MFRIGETLRDARAARDLALADVEQATRIRSKYLAALEAERFDLIPGDAYVRAFLREYAEFLGLDPKPFLEQVDVELEDEEPLPYTPPPVARRTGTGRRLLVLGVLGGATAVGLLAWEFGGGATKQELPGTAPVPPPAQTAPAPVRRPPPARRAAPAGPHLLLTAARGPVWLLVRLGSDAGRAIYESTLEAGRSVVFGRRTLWIRIGAPWNLDLRVDGRPARLPPATGPMNVVVPLRGSLRLS